MTEEEYFRKNYPDSCYGDKPLSPHWDFFQDGVEFGERQSEKRIAELEEENAELKEQVKLWKKASENNSYKAFQLEKENAELKERNRELLESCEGATMMYKDLCKAKEIIKKLINAYCSYGATGRAMAEAEQFLYSEVEK